MGGRTMEEPFVYVFRAALLLIIFGCLIAVFTVLANTGGTIDTTLNNIVSLIFSKAQAAINAVP